MDHVREFLSTVCVLDTETTGVNPETAEIVELATAAKLNHEWHIQSQLFNTPSGVPPEASAKNQISNRMVKDKPYFNSDSLPLIADMLGTPAYFVAHNAEYDRKIFVSAFARMQELDLAEMFANKLSWICTWRVSRHIYQHQFQDQIYGQNYLRYKLDLLVPDSVGVHRAGDDVQVCCALLERIVDDGIDSGHIDPIQPIGPQLVSLTQRAITVAQWPMGKYKGHQLSQIPTDYYIWAIENQGILQENTPGYNWDLAESVRAELETRLASAS
jgi:DNA polymerase III epsilon subunit-like protein